ncbi:unnamed protein product [Lepeophtheirus salmonis]|uniref:(salmon louse) hypothetical protein n=1 Tax=Lepeophtheirus salmonis TaxID=72036 RepID=A0A7R8HCA7_LEPSM|nr:unnamed protein product [Lepeophtheirus salmonis]CAF3003622.1 unnamed protein product [Lepeophtheirus salmonis]
MKLTLTVFFSFTKSYVIYQVEREGAAGYLLVTLGLNYSCLPVRKYFSVIRKKKRDNEFDSESSIEVKKVAPLSSSNAPSSTKKVSISITTTENGEVLNEFDEKEEARRVIQKVLSQEMTKNFVPEKSKKIIEDTLEGLDGRYVPFEEVLNRKSMERSPTPNSSRYAPSSLPSGSSSPSKSYVYLSRESSFVKDDTELSPKKGSRSPSFELFKSKRTSVEKEVTQIVTSNFESVPQDLSPMTAFKNSLNGDKVLDSKDDLNYSDGILSPKEAKLLLSSFNQIHMNGTENSKTGETESSSSRKDSVELSPVVKTHLFLYFIHHPFKDSSLSLSNLRNVNEPTSVPQSFINLKNIEINTQSSNDGTSTEDCSSSAEITDLKPRLLKEENEPSPMFERFLRGESSAEFKKDTSFLEDNISPESGNAMTDERSSTYLEKENSVPKDNISPESGNAMTDEGSSTYLEKESSVPKESISPESGNAMTDEGSSTYLEKENSVPKENISPESGNAMNNEGTATGLEKENSVSKEHISPESGSTGTDEGSSTDLEKDDSGPKGDTSPESVDTMADDVSVHEIPSTDKESKKNDKFVSSTDFRPEWAKISKSNGHVWEKGVAYQEKGRPIPSSNRTEDDDEMSLLSRSQEKDIHSKAPLLSDSDEEEGKLQGEAMVLSQPRIMEEIKEESEEPAELPRKKVKTQDSKGRKKKGRKKINGCICNVEDISKEEVPQSRFLSNSQV